MSRSRWWHAMRLAVCAMVLGGLAQSVRGQDKPPADRKAVDSQVYTLLRGVINHGAELFNEPNHDHNGCYRLYEGALQAVRPFLDHRPGLQKTIDDGLAAAKTRPALADRAFALRDVINKIRLETNPNPTKPPVLTLWDRLGGEPNVKKVVDDFVGAAAADPKVDFTRGGKFKPDVPKLKKDLIAQISSVSGGPLKYTGRSMKEIHKGMSISDAQFNATAAHLEAALKKNGAKPDDIKTVMTVIGSTRGDIVEGAKPPDPLKTLWDKLGGEANVKKVIDDFVGAAATDPKVDFSRGGKVKLGPEEVAKLKKHLVDQVSSLTGGPYKYTGRTMKESHKGMGITDAQFDASAAHLKAALEKNGAKPEDVKTVMDAVGKTRADIVEAVKPPDPPKTMTLWDKLGGEDNVKKVVNDFVTAAGADPKVDFFRGNKPEAVVVTKLKQNLVDQISSLTGGPRPYKGKSMKEAHKGMAITDAQFDATAAHLKTALEKNGAKAEDVKTIMDVVGKTRAEIVEKKPEPSKDKPTDGKDK